ncbi:uncharacterized protein LOC116654559 [Drosophila ananassae]|uniref:uncharacterized protein LOC116654559 n=1 Tax=Drosophila ananassae TaxID=7217 RepID=UPI000177B992|nr:uncharacterized protein LOC116654559 [Drosophila ananassae]
MNSSPVTPVTSRSGYLRGRKRIQVHPIAELQKVAAKKNKRRHTYDPQKHASEGSKEVKIYQTRDKTRRAEAKRIGAENGIAEDKVDTKKRRYPQRKSK